MLECCGLGSHALCAVCVCAVLCAVCVRVCMCVRASTVAAQIFLSYFALLYCVLLCYIWILLSRLVCHSLSPSLSVCYDMSVQFTCAPLCITLDIKYSIFNFKRLEGSLLSIKYLIFNT